MTTVEQTAHWPARPRSLGIVALAIAGVLLATLRPVPANSAPAYKLVQVVSGLNSPVYAAWAPGDNKRMFIVEKGGLIRIFTGGKVLPTPFLDISSLVSTDGERGLLSMAFDPSYGTNRYFYVYYTNTSGTIVVARYQTLASDPNRSGNTARIFATIAHPTYNNHNGGQLQFDPLAAKRGQAMLYFGTGDGGSGGDPNNNAQNLRSGLGKLWRIDVHASKPKRQLFAYGLRNPWRFSFDRLRGDLRIGDVGQDAWEELDFSKAGSGTGKNYGWRKYEGRHLYHNQWINTKLLTWPFVEYPHTNGNCAVVGGYLYRGSVSALDGWYLYGDLCTGNVWREQGRHVYKLGFSGQVSSLVSFAESNNGEVYLVSLDGAIYRISP
jgi:glucose/arabinose dehydrogenase